MTKIVKRYSESFKRHVVGEYEAGSNLASLNKKYGITGSRTVKLWIKKYAKEGLRNELVRIQSVEEADRVKELEKQVKQLEQALGKVVLEKLKLESILEELAETCGVDTKKNAPALSNGCPKKSESKQAAR